MAPPPKDNSRQKDALFPGFSQRLNDLIDWSLIELPRLDAGRQAAFAKLYNVSKMAAGDWLKKDHTPKHSHLRDIVEHLVAVSQNNADVRRVEAWLKYGDDAVPCPLEGTSVPINHLYPLAAECISDACKSIGLKGSDIDLTKTLQQTAKLLNEYEIDEKSDIKNVHLSIIAEYAINNSLK